MGSFEGQIRLWIQDKVLGLLLKILLQLDICSHKTLKDQIISCQSQKAKSFDFWFRKFYILGQFLDQVTVYDDVFKGWKGLGVAVKANKICGCEGVKKWFHLAWAFSYSLSVDWQQTTQISHIDLGRRNLTHLISSLSFENLVLNIFCQLIKGGYLICIREHISCKTCQNSFIIFLR